MRLGLLVVVFALLVGGCGGGDGTPPVPGGEVVENPPVEIPAGVDHDANPPAENPTNGDSGQNPPPEDPGSPVTGASFSGRAVDGYIVNALVFLDLNGNLLFDHGEPFTRTDSTGAFTLFAPQEQIDLYPVVVHAIAGESIDLDDPSRPIQRSYTLVGRPQSSVVSPLTTLIQFHMVGFDTDEETAISSIEESMQLTESDITADFISNSDSDAHFIAAAIVPMLQGVHALQESRSQPMSVAEEIALVNRYAETLVSSNSDEILSAPDRDSAVSTISSKVFVNSASFACSNTDGVLAYVGVDVGSAGAMVINAKDHFWGQLFLAPMTGTLSHVEVFVRNEGAGVPPPSQFHLEVYPWTGGGAGPLVGRSDDVLFIHPNLNERSNAGTRPFVVALNTPVEENHRYVLKIVGDGSIAVDYYYAESPTGRAHFDFSKDGTVHGAHSWYPNNLRSRFCFEP